MVLAGLRAECAQVYRVERCVPKGEDRRTAVEGRELWRFRSKTEKTYLTAILGSMQHEER